jgi:hypothetical protein
VSVITGPGVYPLLQNVRSYAKDILESRPGTVLIGTCTPPGGSAGPVHSLKRLNDLIPGASSSWTRIAGSGDRLFFGESAFNLVTASATINVGFRYGCIVEGVGVGFSVATSPASIKWTGAANGTVFNFSDCLKCVTSNFTIDGNNSEGIGLANTSTTASSQGNIYENLNIINVTGSPGYAIYNGSSTNRQVDTATFKNITVNNAALCWYEDGVNTEAILYEKMNCQDTTSGYFVVQSGDFTTKDNVYLGPNTGGGVTNLFTISNGVSHATLINDHLEISGPVTNVFNFPGVINVSGSTVIIEGATYSVAQIANWFQYTQNGWLTMIGNRFSGVSGDTFTFSPLGGIAYGQTAFLSFFGNNYIGDPTFTFSGPYALSELDPDLNFLSTTGPCGPAAFAVYLEECFKGVNLQFINAPITLSDGTNSVINFRNHAASGFIKGVSKDSSDIVHLGDSAGVVLGEGSNLIYRCTVSGTLPIGALTISAGNCGTAVSTGVTAQ